MAKGSDLLVAALKNEGVTRIFGIHQGACPVSRMNNLAMVHFNVKRWWAFRLGGAASRSSGEIVSYRCSSTSA